MKLFVAFFALIATASAFTVPSTAAAVRPVARVASPPTMGEYKLGRVRIKGTEDEWYDLKDLSPGIWFLGSIFFIHDYLHFQLGMFPGEVSSYGL
jgi:hypothetical protein